MALLEHKARTLQEAMKNLDPVHSLEVDELDRYFVEREQTPVREMAIALQDAYPQKFLFTGHRGNGKSTELAKLENRNAIKNILLQRLEEPLLDTDATELLVDYSGGVPRNIIRLARAACLKARADAATQISADHVHAAIAKERNDFDRMLSHEQRDALQKVMETKVIDQTEMYRDLLHNLSVLEYENGNLWHEVNPVVRDLLK